MLVVEIIVEQWVFMRVTKSKRGEVSEWIRIRRLCLDKEAGEGEK